MAKKKTFTLDPEHLGWFYGYARRIVSSYSSAESGFNKDCLFGTLLGLASTFEILGLDPEQLAEIRDIIEGACYDS